MSPTDDPQLTALKKPARRNISASDFRLPKPYRRQIGSATARTSVRLRVSFVVLSAVPIAALLGALALIVHDNATTPRPLPVLADSREAAPAPPKKARTAARAAVLTAPPAMIAAAVAAPPAPKLAVQGKLREPVGMPIPVHSQAPRQESMPDGAPVAAPDPDVDLIATILLLTPARQPGAPCSALVDEACHAMPQLEP